MKTTLLLIPLFIFSACGPAHRVPESPAEAAPQTSIPRPGFDSGFSPLTETADVDETVVRETLHIRAGARNGNGSESAPFGGIMAAQPRILQLLEAGTPVKVQIGPGIYREDMSGFLRLRQSPEAVQNTPLVIEGCPEGGTLFSGSEPFEVEWVAMDETETLWSAAWPHQWEPDPGPWVATFGHPEIRGETARREALYVGGKMMRLRAIERWSWHQPGGIWWDVYCTDMLVDRSLMYGNGRLGVEMELAAPNGGNWEMRNSIAAWNTSAGAFVSMAANTRLLNNVLAHNGGGELEAEISRGQIVFKVRKHPLKGPQSAEEWESVTIRDNLLFADDGQHFITFLRRNTDPAQQIPFLLDVLDSGNNHYLSATEAPGFSRIEGGYGDFDHWLGMLSARRPDTDHEAGSIRETAPAPDLAAWAEKLGVPWDQDQINAWHHLRDTGPFALENFGL